jgi:glycosyltransferase involved in cell wall biosynthesis
MEVADRPGRLRARAALGLETGAPIALFFGQIRTYKGLDVLIRAFRHVRVSVPNARLFIAGQAVEQWSKYARLIRETGLAGAVDTQIGPIPHSKVGILFAACDVVVLPYRQTSHSAVLMTAYRMERPVIATRVGGLPEAVEDGHSGLLVEPDNPHALAEALRLMLGDAVTRRRMAARAGELSRTTFAWPRIASLTAAVYDAVLGRHAAQRPTAPAVREAAPSVAARRGGP